MKIIPSTPEVLREAVIVLAGALLATLVVRALPLDLRRYFSFTGSNDQ